MNDPRTILTRHPANPILSACGRSGLNTLFNPSPALLDDGRTVLLVSCTTFAGQQNSFRETRVAWSDDGVRFTLDDHPLVRQSELPTPLDRLGGLQHLEYEENRPHAAAPRAGRLLVLVHGVVQPCDGTLSGWYALKEDGTAFTQIKPADGGATVTAYLLSCGVYNDSEHALGHQSQTTAGDYMCFGLRLTNSTGKTLTEFALAFTGEQWRRVSGDTDRLDFAYQVFAPGTGYLTASSGWTDVDTLDFIAPNNTGASAKLDGNSAANRVALSDTVKGLSWEDGKELWLRWSDRNGPTNRHMMAIDDVTFSAQPDQGTVVMVR